MSTPESNGRPPAAPPSANDADDLDDLDERDDDPLEDDEKLGLDIAFTPRQILGGFALLAGLILLLRRRRRGQ
jgi:hypothetical protein